MVSYLGDLSSNSISSFLTEIALSSLSNLILQLLNASKLSKVRVSTSNQKFSSEFSYFLFWVVHYVLNHPKKKVLSFVI